MVDGLQADRCHIMSCISPVILNEKCRIQIAQAPPGGELEEGQ